MKTKNFMLILTAAVTIVLSSCGGKMSPYVYNETIVAIHSNSWDYLHEKMERIYDHENTSKEQAELIIDSLNQKFDSYIKRLNEMQYPDGAEEWHKSTTALLVFAKDSVIPLYSKTLDYKPESKEWYKVWKAIDHRLQVEASALEDKMIAEQEKFAKATGEQLK